MLLSIGMIVKNEERFLEQCLNGIKPLLARVDSELIIADTGSTDRSVEIAKKFTDKVYHFEWNNDFSAARNSTLERSNGEWYMYIDADEIFSSCDEIIEFLTGDEKQKYNSVSFIVRSYESLDDKEKYGDSELIRLVRKNDNLKFVGEFHEALNNISKPLKQTSIIVDHYGYAFKDDTIKKYKSQRNQTALLKMYAKKKTPRLMLELYLAISITSPDEADKYWNEAVQICNNENSIYLIPLYIEKIRLLYNALLYEKSLDLCNRYFEIKKEIRPDQMSMDVEVWGIKANILKKMGCFNEAIECYDNFFKTYNAVKSGQLRTPDIMLSYFSVGIESNYFIMHNGLIASCINAHKYELASDYLELVSISDYKNNKAYIQHRIDVEMEIMKNIGFTKARAENLYNSIDGESKDYFICLLEQEIITTEKACEIIEVVKASNINNRELKETCDIAEKICKNNIQNIDSNHLGKAFNIVKQMMFSSKSSEKNSSGLFELFGYIADILSKGSSQYDDDLCAGIIINEITAAHKEKNYKLCISEMRKLVKEYPSFAPFVTDYQKILKSEIQNVNSQQLQLAQMAAAVKQNIKGMINAGDHKTAEKTLFELQKLCPEDEDIMDLKALIEKIK